MTYFDRCLASIQCCTSSSPFAYLLRQVKFLIVTGCHFWVFWKRYVRQKRTRCSSYNLSALSYLSLNIFPRSQVIWLTSAVSFFSRESDAQSLAISKSSSLVNSPKNFFTCEIHFEMRFTISIGFLGKILPDYYIWKRLFCKFEGLEFMKKIYTGFWRGFAWNLFDGFIFLAELPDEAKHAFEPVM